VRLVAYNSGTNHPHHLDIPVACHRDIEAVSYRRDLRLLVQTEGAPRPLIEWDVRMSYPVAHPQRSVLDGALRTIRSAVTAMGGPFDSLDGRNAHRATHLVFIAHHLERIADRATNIAEDLVHLETGVIEELG
jgi:hypothetical protein